MKIRICISLFLVLGLFSCKNQLVKFIYQSDQLKVEKLSNHTYRHISYLATEDYGNVACNGMIVIDNGEALVFDTPTNNKDSKELIDWIETTLNCKIVGVIATHFHSDCVGGLGEFHERQILSYASSETIKLLSSDSVTAPKIGFEGHLEIKVGDKAVINEFFGEGHTSDNLVSYFPTDDVLFGGCLIKKLDASKGYLGDAKVQEWARTVQAIKTKYKTVKIVIPGHGKPGGIELLNYTMKLFQAN